MGRPNRATRYFGTFSNREGKERAAFIQWREGKGWMVHDAVKGNAIIPTATPTIKELLQSVKFERNGKSEKIEAEVSADQKAETTQEPVAA